MDETIEKFLDAFARSVSTDKFVKLTLGNYRGADEHLQKIFVRPVDTRHGPRLLFQYRAAARDTVRNFDALEAVDQLRRHLSSGFRSGHLFTTEKDHQLTVGKRSARLVDGKPTFETKPARTHDREKRYIVDPHAYYLNALGITTDSGEIRADQRDKWKQINKFVEILDGLVEDSPLKDSSRLNIVDMGSGKGYLTFAAYDHFARKLSGSGPIAVNVTGVEARRELVDLCNEIASAGGLEGLRFVQGSIAELDPGNVDILIALHACDTATDDALFQGVAANASVIVAAPCCHQELKKQIRPPGLLAGILKHPVLLERTAETITDGLRSMLLENEGYKTKMFEFVATEHTPKNNMLVAVKRSPSKPAGHLKPRIEELRGQFAIEHQRLADLLDQRQIGEKLT